MPRADVRRLLMRNFIVIFFCSFLSSGKLEAVQNENNNYAWQSNNNGMLPVVEEHIWPKHAYLTYQANQFDKDRTGTTSKPCLKQGDIQDGQLKQVIVPSPTRRSSASESEKNPVTSFESANLQYRDNNLRRTYIEQNPQTPELITDENVQSETQNNLQDIRSTSTEALSEEIYENTPQVNEIIPLDHEKAAPVLETVEPESYNRQITRHQLATTLQPAVESKVHQTEAQCSDKRKANPGTEPPRRFLLPTYNIPNRNSGIRPNGNIYSNYVLRTGNNNMPDQVRNENGDASNFNSKPAPSSVRTNNEDQNIDTPSYKTSENSVGRSGRIHYILKGNGNNNLIDPTKGNGISHITKTTRMMLMDFDRVCYACSTANNPNCLSPDRRTPVKYCRKGDNACVVKSFGTGSSLTFVRDCGKSCDDAEILGLIPKYKTCSMCHSDLCNGALSMNIHSLMLIMPTIVTVSVIKSLL